MKASFNSLQTGRCITRVVLFSTHTPGVCVSIPFKREGVSQESIDDAFGIKSSEYEFQFPSNGKVYHKQYRLAVSYGLPQFQFPSNGKVYHKRPHFKPSGAVASKAQNQTRSAHAYFYVKIFPKNPTNPHKH